MTGLTFDNFLYQGDEIITLRRQIEERRMVYAVLITGETGTGKRTLAGILAAALVCKAEAGVPCGDRKSVV